MSRLRTSVLFVLVAGRAAIGLALLVRPALVTVPWTGRREARRRANKLLAGAVGGRDVALAGGLAHAALRDGAVSPWLLAGAVADAADLVVTVRAQGAIPASGRRATIALAGASALAALALASWRGR